MNTASAGRFALFGSSVALAVALPLVLLGARHGRAAVAWGGLGWAALSTVAIVGGAWMCRHHGRPGAGFLVAMGTTMLVRLALAAAGCAAAASVGPQAVWPFLVGAVAGFVPLQIFEVAWFYRAARPLEGSGGRG